MMQTAQVDTLLRIHPLELEHQFWNSQEIRSKMCVLDVIAFALVVPNLVAAVLGRVKRHLPDGVTLPWGAKAILIMYWFLSLVPVLLMLTRMGWYNTWRQPLVLINRTYRAGSAAALTHPATVLGYVTQVAAVRTAAFGGHTLKAVLTCTLLPSVMHMQQTHQHLPFRLLVPFQVACFLVAVLWAQGMPCWLPLPSNLASSANNSGIRAYPHPFVPLAQAPADARSTPEAAAIAASRAAAGAAAAFEDMGAVTCELLRLVHALIFTSMALPNFVFADKAVALCRGASAFQLLYLYVAAVVLLVVPCLSVYSLEYLLKRHWLRARNIAIMPASPNLASPDPASPDSAGGNTAGRKLWPCPSMRPAVVAVLLVGGAWKLAEVLTAVMQGRCAPPLGSSIFEWMSALF